MYSIKTDLGVLGNSTLEKALLVKGDAVFKQNVTIEGTVSFANATFTTITVTGAANFNGINATGTTALKDLTVSGNTVLGDASTDTVQINGTASFAEPTSFASDITQLSGTASLNDVEADTLSVSGLTKLDGNLTMLPTSTATMGDVDVQDLTVNGVTTFKGLSTFEQKASFGDVEITGQLSGAFTMANGNFTNITVTNDSNLNKLNVTGNAIFSSNISGLSSTATLQNITMNGQTALLTFNYSDPANPSYIRTSIQPYKVSTQEIQANLASIGRVNVGKESDATSAEGLHSLGKATMDYVAIKGNSTIGTSQPQLTVAGTSVFSGKTTVGDLEITGSVSGLTFDDMTINTLTVNGASSLQNVTMSGNLTALTSTATIQGITMNGASAIISFNYTDSTNPSYIKSSIQPYKVSSHEFQGDVASIRELRTGVVNDSIVGHTGLGVNELDYLHVKGNTTIGTARKQLIVDGDSQFANTMTVENIVITGTTTGITADVAGVDITPNSVTATAGVTSETLESTTTTTVGTDLTVLNGTATIKDLVVTGTTTGVTVTADVDGLDIAPNSVSSVAGVTVGTDLSVTNGTATIKDLVVTGTTTGVTVVANVDGLDIKPATIETTGIATIAGDLTAEADVIVTGTVQGAASGALKTGAIDVTGNVDVSGAVNAENATLTKTGVALAVTNDATIGGTLTVKDVTVTGTLTPAAIDLSSTDVIAQSVSTTGNIHTDTTLSVGTDATIGGNLTVTGDVTGTLKTTAITNSGTLSTDTATVTGTATVGTVQSATIQAAAAGAGTLNLASDVTAAKNLTVNGTFTPAGGLDLSGAAINSASVSTTGNVQVGGDLTVNGTFDLSATNLSALSLASTGNTTVGSELILTTGVVTGSPEISGTLDVTGTTTLSTLSTSGLATLNSASVGTTLNVTGATTVAGLTAGSTSATTLSTSGKATLNSLEVTNDGTVDGDFTVNGVFTPAGGLDLGSAALDVASVTTTGIVSVGTDATVGGTLNVTDISTLSGGISTSAVTASGLVTAQAGVTTTTLTASGAITGATTITSTGRTTAGEVQVGAGAFDSSYKMNVFGNSIFNGDVYISGKLNGTIDLSGVDLNPRNVVASGDGSFAGTLTAGDTLTAPVGIFGAAGSLNNSLQVNGNVVATGDFEVGGVIKGTLDQSAAAVKVGSLETMLADGVKIGGNGPLVLGSGGIVTGNPVISGDTSVGGTFTSTGLATLNGGLTVTGTTTLGATTAASLSVTGISTLTGNTTVGGTLGVTGKTTVGDLEITGTLTTDIADLVTDSVTTKRYAVTPTTVSGTVTGTWTPDGTSSVYNISSTGALQIGPMPNPGGNAGSWFIYVTNTDGGSINMDSSYGLVGGTWGTAPGSVTICQVVYCGVGSTYDVFLAQRP